MQRPFKVVKIPVQRATRMPRQSQLLLKALLGLKKGECIQLKCADYTDAFRSSKVLMRFIYDARKSKKLLTRYSVCRGKIEEDWFVSVAIKT